MGKKLTLSNFTRNENNVQQKIYWSYIISTDQQVNGINMSHKSQKEKTEER